MNCKQGELAIVVRCRRPEAVGKIVTCVKFVASHDGVAAWRVDPPFGPPVWEGGVFYSGDWIRDSGLRPLRDNNGQDETLTWAGKPERITA